jgi:hypothetical protein
MTDAQTRGRRTLVLIALLFATPIFVAMYMYYSSSALNPVDSSAFGELITPPRPLPEMSLLADDDASLRKLWALIVLADKDCDSACNDALVHIRQIRLSLGPKMSRLQTVFLPAQNMAIADDLQTRHPKLIIASPDHSADIRAIIGAYEPGEIFIADPLGNLMMSYPPGTDMGDIRKDIAHLLKLSGIG